MNFETITLSWDLFVLLFFLIVVLYSVLMGRNKIVGLLVNFYIALAVVLVAGEGLFNIVANFGFISNQLAVSEFATKTIFLVALVIPLSIKSEIAGLDSAGTVSKLSAGFYGFLAAGLALSTTFYFMTDIERLALDSNFVNLVYQYFSIWVLGPIVFMIGNAFVRKN